MSSSSSSPGAELFKSPRGEDETERGSLFEDSKNDLIKENENNKKKRTSRGSSEAVERKKSPKRILTAGDSTDRTKKTEDKKTEDKKTEDKKTEDKKTEDKKTEDKDSSIRPKVDELVPSQTTKIDPISDLLSVDDKIEKSKETDRSSLKTIEPSLPSARRVSPRIRSPPPLPLATEDEENEMMKSKMESMPKVIISPRQDEETDIKNTINENIATEVLREDVKQEIELTEISKCFQKDTFRMSGIDECSWIVNRNSEGRKVSTGNENNFENNNYKNISREILFALRERIQRLEKFLMIKNETDEIKIDDEKIISPFFKDVNFDPKKRSTDVSNMRSYQIRKLMETYKSTNNNKIEISEINKDSKKDDLSTEERISLIRKSVDVDTSPDWTEQLILSLSKCDTVLDRVCGLCSTVKKIFRGHIGTAEGRLRALCVSFNASDGPQGLARALANSTVKRTYVLESSNLISYIASQCRQIQEARQGLDIQPSFIDGQKQTLENMKERIKKAENESLELAERTSRLDSRMTKIINQYVDITSSFFILYNSKLKKNPSR